MIVNNTKANGADWLLYSKTKSVSNVFYVNIVQHFF